MKQIIIDYDLYKKELQEAYNSGEANAKELAKLTGTYIALVNSGIATRNDIVQLEFQINQLIRTFK